jgi:hypothetical protein
LRDAGQHYDCQKTDASKANSEHIKSPFHFSFFPNSE